MAVNQRKAGVILTYAQIILNNTASLLYTPIVLRMLGQSQYGLFGTAASLTSYLNLLTLGIGGAFVTWNAKYRAANDVEGERRLNGMYFTMFSIITIVTMVVGLAMVLLSDLIFAGSFTSKELYDLKWVLFINVLSTAATFFFSPFNMYIIIYERFVLVKVVAMINGVALPVANLVVLYLGGEAVAMSWCNFVFTMLNFIVYTIYARKRLNMKFVFRGFDWRVFKGIFIFSSFLLLNSITDILTGSTDSVILGAIWGPVMVAVYAIGKNFQNYFQSFTIAISSVFAPQVNRMVAEGESNESLTRLMLKIARIQFYVVALITLGYTFIGKRFVELWASDKYSDAYYIGLLLILGTIIPLIQNVGLEIQKAKNKHKFRSVVYFFVALANIGMTIPFSIWWGAIGATLATFLCCVFGQAIAMNIYYAKGIGLNMIMFWKGILSMLPGFIPTVVVGILMNVLLDINSIWTFLLCVIVLVAVYCVSIWLFCMNDYEKDLFIKPLKKVFGRFSRKGKAATE